MPQVTQVPVVQLGSVPLRGGLREEGGAAERAEATHVGLRAEEVEAILVDGQDAGGRHSEAAAALDEEEGGAEQR